MPTSIQKRPSLATINQNQNLNREQMRSQVAKKARLQASAQPSGFEDDLEELTKDIHHGGGTLDLLVI